MEWTGLNDLREKFLEFYESKGHLRLPSFPLIPQGDKSLLLINAGMAPLKKYFTGELTPPSTRVTTCQKCIRTPDIERVGKTSRHGTYFEMLGNFSFGDYFKIDATAWAWEFCTKVIGLPVDKLYVSVYLDDDEAWDIWTKRVGVDPSHMVRLGKEDNFWELGVGPCGPCSEIYFDRGEQYGCGSPDCKVGCDCDRYVEFWNLVFTQFSNDGAGNYTPLAKPNIDTGMGLERLACIVQGVDNLFEVDTVQNIMKHVSEIAGIKYREDEKSDVSLRVITDHIRSTTFMIGDGVIPSNEGRGYVLRRLLRRAARHGRLLGIDRPFLAEVCETVINENRNAYPILAEKREYITRVIENEEDSFGRTIDTGLHLLEQLISAAGAGSVLRGEDAFRLADTFGFPLDLTKEILAEKDMTLDEDEYTRLAAEQRARSRASHKNAGAEGWKDTGVVTKGLPATVFKGYDSLDGFGTVLCIIDGGERAESLENGKQAVLVTDSTTFYAESGGQAGDSGIIRGEDWTFEVTATTKTNDGVFLHHGMLTEGESLRTGDKIMTKVDADLRAATMRNHTAAHLLQAALRKVLGSHVEQAGQSVGAQAMRFDFSHFSALTNEELAQVELEVNRAILSNMDVTGVETDIETAKAKGAMALFGEKYGKIVRMVSIGDFSIELCGGTHVSNTGKLGLFKILSETSVAAGVRRIEAVTGYGVLDYISSLNNTIVNTAKAMKLANITELEGRAAALMNELKSGEKEIEKLSGELSAIKSEGLLKNAVSLGKVRLITATVKDMSNDEVRLLCDKAKQSGDDIVAVVACVNSEKGNASIAVACAPGAVKSGANAGAIVRAIAQKAGGNGGGKPDFAMAGAKDLALLPDAMSSAEETVSGMIK